MEEVEQKDETITEKIKCQLEEEIECIADERINRDNVEYLGQLIDIHKDLANEDYWLEKEDFMRYGNYGRDSYQGYDDSYGNYGTYGGGRRRDSRGRYMEGGRGSYGRRYRGHDIIDDMSENYGKYMENRENGRYGSPETDKAFDYMLQSATDFIDHIFNEIDSPEQAEKFKREIKMTIERMM